MSSARRHAGAGKGLGEERGPVSGSARHCERAAGARRGGPGQPSALSSRREAVLRVLLEAYRRDVGPGGLDPR